MPGPVQTGSDTRDKIGLSRDRWGAAVRPSEPSQINQIQLFRPQCSKCRTLMVLARIEPSSEPDHDLRTFECAACGNDDVLKIKFK